MNSNGGVCIDSSSDDDEDFTIFHPRRLRAVPSNPQETQHNQEASQAVSAAAAAAFARCVQTALPIKLIPRDLAAYIQRESNVRFEIATEQGVTTDEVYIGDDCLPTWPGMAWDPKEESLHSVIQARLLDHEISRELGDLLRREIIIKGNRRLEEARELGIELRDLFLGDRLLATWPKLRFLDEDGSDHDTTAGGLADDEMDMISVSDVRSFASCEAGDNDHFDYQGNDEARAAETMDSDPPAWMEPFVFVSNTDSGSESDISSAEDIEDMGEVFEREKAEHSIWMTNFVGPEPVCTDSDSEQHIIHGVELVGSSSPVVGLHDVDLEIYVADGDEDLEDLPEVEMAVDGDAWDHWFGEEGGQGVDVDVEDMEIVCVGELLGQDGDYEYEYGDGDGDFDEESSAYESCKEEEDILRETEHGLEW